MASPPRVLLVAPERSYRTGAFMRASADLRLELTVASWGQHPLAINSNGIRLRSECTDQAVLQIQETAVQHPFSAVIATDDSTVPLAKGISEKLETAYKRIACVIC